MAIYDYAPRYHQLEVNNLKGLYAGLVVAQMEVDEDNCDQIVTNTVTGSKHLENGVILTISKNGVKDVAAAGDVLFINYVEPLNTLIDSPKFYAVDLAEENPRLVQLCPGDEWMTDIDYLTATVDGNDNPYYNANLVGRIEKVAKKGSTTGGYSNDDWFETTTLADGTPAFHYVFIK